MGFSKVLFSSLALAALSCLSSVEAQPPKTVPWDGRGQDLTVATLENKFKLHILKQRQSGTGNPADYVTVDPKGRAAYNGDTGVISVAVDDKAIFGGQTTFRRSELVQDITSAPTTFFRASIMADKAIVNKHVWQVFFPESHSWEVFVDATSATPKIQFKTESRVQWETDFVVSSWYNFGIEVASSGITLYTSTGNAELKQSFADKKAAQPPSSYELHFGMLTLSGSGAAPTMTGRDALLFNGVSVENKASTSGGAAGEAPGPAPVPATTPSQPGPVPVTTTSPPPPVPTTTTPAIAPVATPATTKPPTAPASGPAPTVRPTPATTPKPTSKKCNTRRRRN